ncbi:MAG: hypothetical protein ACKVS5_02670 [Parvularculaceae bacterium]
MSAKRTIRTSAGLRDLLFDEIDKVRGEGGDAYRALAVAKLAQQIIGTVKVEMAFHQLATAGLDSPPTTPILGALPLGSSQPE